MKEDGAVEKERQIDEREESCNMRIRKGKEVHLTNRMINEGEEDMHESNTYSIGCHCTVRRRIHVRADLLSSLPSPENTN